MTYLPDVFEKSFYRSIPKYDNVFYSASYFSLETHVINR